MHVGAEFLKATMALYKGSNGEGTVMEKGQE